MPCSRRRPGEEEEEDEDEQQQQQQQQQALLAQAQFSVQQQQQQAAQGQAQPGQPLAMPALELTAQNARKFSWLTLSALICVLVCVLSWRLLKTWRFLFFTLFGDCSGQPGRGVVARRSLHCPHSYRLPARKLIDSDSAYAFCLLVVGLVVDCSTFTFVVGLRVSCVCLRPRTFFFLLRNTSFALLLLPSLLPRVLSS